MTNYFNPYAGQDFAGFLFQFFSRLLNIFSLQDLATDEIQIIVLSGVAAASAMVGSFLIYRRMTMLANSLSHTILLGIVLTFIFAKNNAFEGSSGTLNVQAMLFASVAMGIVTTFLTEFLTKSAKLQEDASTGLVFTTLFAISIIIVTLYTRDAHIGIEVVMGNADALNADDINLVYIILGINILLFLLFFKEYKLTTFDPALARALGFSTIFFNYLLMLQVSATVVGAFRAVGAIMVLAFITGPPLTARLLTHNLKKMILIAIGIGVFTSIISVALSRHLLSVWGMPLSTGGLTVCVITVIYLSTIMMTRLVEKLRRRNPKGENSNLESPLQS